MESEIRHLADFADYDKLPKIESKVAFISLASRALSMISEADLDALVDTPKAWEGLAWITEEIKDEIRDWHNQI